MVQLGQHWPLRLAKTLQGLTRLRNFTSLVILRGLSTRDAGDEPGMFCRHGPYAELCLSPPPRPIKKPPVAEFALGGSVKQGRFLPS